MISSGDPYDRFTRFIFSSWTEPLSATDFFREFEETSEELYRLFEEFQDMPSVTPNRLSRKYENIQGEYVTATEVYVYLSSLEVGSRAEPTLNQFRKVGQEAKSGTNGRNGRINRRKSFVKREPLFDIIKSANDVKIIAELPAVNKEDIRVKVIDGFAEIVTRNGSRKYKRRVEIPLEADTDTGRSRFNNSFLEITFDKKKHSKKGKVMEIK